MAGPSSSLHFIISSRIRNKVLGCGVETPGDKWKGLFQEKGGVSDKKNPKYRSESIAIEEKWLKEV